MARELEEADTINKHIGHLIKEKRLYIGLTQRELASILGVTVPQMHKYETGESRISAARLALTAAILNTPVQDFFNYRNSAVKHNDDGNCRLRLEVTLLLRQIKNRSRLEAIHQFIKSMADRVAAVAPGRAGAPVLDLPPKEGKITDSP